MRKGLLMQKILKSFLLGIVLFIPFNLSAQDCVSCITHQVASLPSSSLFDNKIPIEPITDKERYFEILDYCLKFEMIPKEMVTTLIKKMLTTPISPEQFLTEPVCLTETYNNNVRMPMLHFIAEDPIAREDFLRLILLYYEKKAKQPEIFKRVVNAKNSKGDTLLDYLEILRLKNNYRFDTQKVALKSVIKILCDNGAVYATTKNKACPTE